MKRQYWYFSLFVFLFLAMPFSVGAQNVLEEVTVTAQKREQSMQEVGIAITGHWG